MRLFFLACLLFLYLPLANCVPTYESHGYVLQKKAVEKVKLGMDKEAISGLMGTPTLISPVDGKEWYYMWTRHKLETYHLPRLVDQLLITLSFDGQNKLTHMGFTDIKSSHPDVAFSHDQTPIYGRQAGSFEQFIAGSILAAKNNT